MNTRRAARSRTGHGDPLLPSASSGRRDALFAQLRKRTLVVRALDGQGMMLGFELADGRELEQGIEKVFGHACAEYLHVHFAAPGCYAAPAERA